MTRPVATSFFIVRHGESTWNAVRRWQGRADPPLSERGEGQARGAVAGIDQLGPLDGVATSTLQRARRTGEVLAEGGSMPLLDAVEPLAERSAGEWEGLTRVEIEAAYPGFLADGARPPGYESDESIVTRVLDALDALAGTHPGERLLVVSHGGVIHALERHVGAEDGDWRRLDNLEGRWFERADDGHLIAVGDRLHLLASAPTTAEDEGYA